MKNEDFIFIEDDYSTLVEAYARRKYHDWAKAKGPGTPSDYPDEQEAYEEGYLQAIADLRAGIVS